MAEPVTLTINQKVLVTLSVTDRAGNPATFDEPPEWDASSAALDVKLAGEDGLSVWLVSGEQVEEAVMVTVRGDADLGEGVREVVGTLQVNLTSGEAQFVELQPGAPEAKG